MFISNMENIINIEFSRLDNIIVTELLKFNIEIVRNSNFKNTGFLTRGKLLNFLFLRWSSFYRIEGSLPLSIAVQLKNNPDTYLSILINGYYYGITEKEYLLNRSIQENNYIKIGDYEALAYFIKVIRLNENYIKLLYL